jgi:ABC-type sugar transport system ATPase subunit
VADVRLESIACAIGKKKILDDLSLEVADGEFVVLVGASGSGKSTILRIVAGLLEPSKGRVLIGGRDVTRALPRERDAAMVFQSYALYPHMTVAENLEFPLKMAKVEKAERRRRVAETARALELGDLLDRLPAQLSGGQQQRVALGRAIIRRPAVCLFDEPLSNLDSRLRQDLRAEIARVHRSFKMTSVYVTHDQSEAMALADRLVVLSEGKIEQIGAPLEVYARPANVFVARTIGDPPINLLPGRIVGGRLSVFDRSIGECRRGDGDVTVGIRPSDLTAGPGLSGTIASIERFGAFTHVRVAILDAVVLWSTSAEFDGKAGEKLELAPRAGAVHVFDRGTGRRLREGEAQGNVDR